MINTIKNDEGYVKGYIEWSVVDKDGKCQRDGKYIYINNLWIHPDHRFSGLTGILSQQIYEHDYSKQAKYIYWQIVRDVDGVKIIDEEERSFQSKRMSKLFDKEYILKKVTIKGDKL